MKKTLLSLCLISVGFAAQSQVVVAGVSPAAIQGNYDYNVQTDAGWPSAGTDANWGLTLDFSVPGTFIIDTLMLAEDGTPGVNLQGIDSTYEACYPLINDLTGKIAVLYRNTCDFASKAWNAQEAGAIAVIVINRDNDVALQMSADPLGDGPNVIIPVCIISSSSGAALVAEMGLGSVVMFIGNKIGAFPNDAGMARGSNLISKTSGVPSQLAQNGTEYNFELGTRVYNYGANDQTSMSLTASVDGPGGNLFSETVTLPTILAGDSMDVDPSQAINFSQFSSATYPAGVYTLTYSLALDSLSDDFDSDNELMTSFMVSDSIYTLANLDTLTGLPTQNAGYRPSTNTSTFSTCINFDNANGSRLGVEGFYFHALGSAVDLTGEEIALYVYRWEDVFTDLNDAAIGFNNLNPIGNGYYYYPSDLQGETVYGALNFPVQLEDNQRFLFCVQTVNLDVFLGYNTNMNYLWNEGQYLQPLGPVENDGVYTASGFGMDLNPSLAARVGNVDSYSYEDLDENGTIEGIAYPNPAKDIVTISIETTEGGTIVVTDLAGKVVMTDALSFANGNAVVNIADLESGLYIFNVTLDNGLSSQFNVVKN